VYFTLLDASIDSDKLSYIKGIGKLKSYTRTHYLSKLGQIDSSYRWKEWLNKMENLQISNGEINERSVIMRSEPLFKAFLALSNFKSKSFLTALEKYSLAKQYNDDLHDFVEDIDSNRKTLVTIELKGVSDPYMYFINKLLPKTINKIEKLLNDSESVLKRFTPIQVLEQGLSNYKKKRLRLDQN
jgi:hypothetical protein